MRFCRVGGGGAKAFGTLWLRCVWGLRPVGWVHWWGWQVVRVQRCLRGLPRVRVDLGGLVTSVVGVVAVRIWFLGGEGAALGGRPGSGVGRPVGVADSPGGGAVRAYGAAGTTITTTPTFTTSTATPENSSPPNPHDPSSSQPPRFVVRAGTWRQNEIKR